MLSPAKKLDINKGTSHAKGRNDYEFYNQPVFNGL